MISTEKVPVLLEPVARLLQQHPRASLQLNRALAPFENLFKVLLFGCNMCGQCVLHETGFVCPMNCPKQLRNGPCGGVRLDGHCEVKPEMVCVWLRAERRARRLPWWDDFLRIRPPLDWRRKGSSAILNLLAGWPEERKATE